MSSHDFSQVDVFASGPLSGNPVAVVHAAQGVEEGAMLDFARWTNLSETTFLLPPTDPGADYRLRIFTPGGELPFAGHPTLGSAHAWLEAGGTPRRDDVVVQECGVGLVEVRRGARLAFAAPDFVREGPVAEELLATVRAGLGLAEAQVLRAHHIDNGPGWIGLQLRDAATVLAIEPDWATIDGLDVGVIGQHDDREAARLGASWEVRAFCDFGVEDPVTGSLNAGFALWLGGQGVLPASYVARQGTAIGRDGRIHVDRDDAGVTWVGGEARTVVAGTVRL